MSRAPTPGPYFMTASDADGAMVVDARGTILAVWPQHGGTPEQCATARMFAEAPAMLEALRATEAANTFSEIEAARTMRRAILARIEA